MQKNAPLKLFNFDRDAIQQRLNLIELTREDEKWVHELHKLIIEPNIKLLVDDFYHKIMHSMQIAQIAAAYELAEMKQTQKQYLSSLGKEFYSSAYFETRLRIGLTHSQIQLSPALYQCACYLMQQQLIDLIPEYYPDRKNLIDFILKIVALDSSLALEAYQSEFNEKLKVSVLAHDKSRQKPLSIDELTGILNRKGILELLTTKLYTVAFPKPLSILIAHVDHLDKIDQEHHNATKENLLKDIVGHFQGLVRGNNTIGRFGSQEFLILLHNTDLEQGHTVAERLRSHIEKQNITPKQAETKISLSIGIACASPDDTMITLIERADSALYEARRRGHNRVIGAAL